MSKKALEETLDSTLTALELAQKTLVNAEEIQIALEEAFEGWIQKAETAVERAREHLQQVKNNNVPEVGRTSGDLDSAKYEVEEYLKNLKLARDETARDVKEMIEKTNSDAETVLKNAKEHTKFLIVQSSNDDGKTQTTAVELASETMKSAKNLASKMKNMASTRKMVIIDEIESLIHDTDTMLQQFSQGSAVEGWNQVGDIKIRNAENILSEQNQKLAILQDERDSELSKAQKTVTVWEQEIGRLNVLVAKARKAAQKKVKGTDFGSYKKLSRGSNAEVRFQEIDVNDDGIIDEDEMYEEIRVARLEEFGSRKKGRKQLHM
jgi:hypothetical protein